MSSLTQLKRVLIQLENLELELKTLKVFLLDPVQKGAVQNVLFCLIPARTRLIQLYQDLDREAGSSGSGKP